MTMHQFNACSTEKKSELVWEWGYYITHLKNETRNIVFFSLGSFLAEVHYALPSNRIDSIKGISIGELPPEFPDNERSHPFVLAARKASGVSS